MPNERLKLNEALDRMLVELNIKAKEVCERSGVVSESRLSSFRSGIKGNMGTDLLDAVLDAAQSINPRAREVFANYIGGQGKLIEEMTLAEKGALMMAIAKSIQGSKNTDLLSEKNA